jgi:toxin CptA
MNEGNEKIIRWLKTEPNAEYSEEELDAIEAEDADLAYRLARLQALKPPQHRSDAPLPDALTLQQQVETAINEARKILQADGGDIALLAIQERTVIVEMRGACVGCPRSVLDLKHIVEALVRRYAPAIAEVRNRF